MKKTLSLTLGSLALASLAGCVEDTGDSGLSGTPDQFASMTGPCISQASRMRGVPQAAIMVSDRLQTGGGPLLVLDVAGENLSCRTEPNGSVTVFSEYAN